MGDTDQGLGPEVEHGVDLVGAERTHHHLGILEHAMHDGDAPVESRPRELRTSVEVGEQRHHRSTFVDEPLREPRSDETTGAGDEHRASLPGQSDHTFQGGFGSFHNALSIVNSR